MSGTLPSNIDKSADPTVANQAACADLTLLFTLLITGLAGAIARTGGKPLADQFEQQLNRFATQHGWSVLTGLTDLNDLKQRVPSVDAKILLSVYLSYIRYARMLAGQALGEQMLKSVLLTLLNRLPPHLADLNRQYKIIFP